MVVNFRVRGIDRGVRKFTQTPMLIIKKKTCFSLKKKHNTSHPSIQYIILVLITLIF